MTFEETGTILDILSGAYPNFHGGENTLKVWYDIFGDYDVRIVAAAVKSFISSDEKGFPPVPGQIMGKLRLITEQGTDTEMEAWGKVLKAISRGIYNAKEDFERFPEEIQRIVGSPNQLKEWAIMDSDIVNSVIASNFQRSYRAKMKQKAEFDALPPDVKQLVSAISGKLTGSFGETKAIGG